MRKTLVVATTAGVLTLSGLAVAVPALADPATSDGAAAADRIRDALSGLVDDGTLTDAQADEVADALAGAGLGGHGGGPQWARAGLETAAEALGMTEDELREALDAEGATLADVAEAQGVAVEDLVAALVQAAEERIAEAVEEGRLTQEEADERLADLEQRITEGIQSDRPLRGGGPGHGPGHGPGSGPGQGRGDAGD